MITKPPPRTNALCFGVNDLDALGRVGPQGTAGLLPVEQEGFSPGLLQRSDLGATNE